MFRDLNQVTQEALQLSSEERLQLADRLYESVPEDDISRAWLEVVERRDAEWDAGKVKGVSVNEVVREARARSRK